MDENLWRRLAYHEAGHAIVGDDRGFDVDLVSIGVAEVIIGVESPPPNQCRLKKSDYDKRPTKPISPELRERIEARLRQLLAGGMAQERAGFLIHDWENDLDARDDVRRIKERLTLLSCNPTERAQICTEAKEHTARILAERWSDVERLAESLLAKHREKPEKNEVWLIGEELESAMRRPPPEGS